MIELTLLEKFVSEPRFNFLTCNFYLGFPGGTVVKNPPANAGDPNDASSIHGSGRSPGERNSNPL